MEKTKSIDEKYMARCLQLAACGQRNAAPNPMVGAVIVYNGKIIGEGYHIRCGEAHAEVNAIRSVKDPSLLQKATIYVSLEPCSHYGKTPPCADLIISKQIPRVVIGCMDPFSLVAGRGIAKLKAAQPFLLGKERALFHRLSWIWTVLTQVSTDGNKSRGPGRESNKVSI